MLFLLELTSVEVNVGAVLVTVTRRHRRIRHLVAVHGLLLLLLLLRRRLIKILEREVAFPWMLIVLSLLRLLVHCGVVTVVWDCGKLKRRRPLQRRHGRRYRYVCFSLLDDDGLSLGFLFLVVVRFWLRDSGERRFILLENIFMRRSNCIESE